MQNPRITYKEDLKIKGVRKIYETEFENKYYKNGERGFLELDEQSVLTSKIPIPGKFYTFDYDPLYKDKLSFYDLRPIVFFHANYRNSSGETYLIGCNYNFFMEETKVDILSNIWRTMNTSLDEIERKIESDKLGLNARYYATCNDLKLFLKTIDPSNSLSYRFGIRHYLLDRIKSLKLIELDDWNKLVFYKPKHIIGVNYQNLHKLYNNNKAYDLKYKIKNI